ncbi:GerMN domain-containing protein [Streptomyces sp. NBRC 110465]|uniref:GerMN domain-containing protein n=1 Tax=Streptomyces sp. NBRC 110465 TaxID=1897621 RepID=UPI000934292F|nr:GerMN domain-containing protein [Streptomyces sp. NBRC 110465]
MIGRPTARTAATVVAGVLALTVAGCGITPTGPAPAGAPASGIQRPGTEARTVQIYFAGPYGLRAVSRPTDRPLSPQQALDLLLEGPTPAERDRGLITQVPPMAGQLTATATDGAVDIHIPRTVSSGDLDVTAVAQLACTAAHAHIPGDRPATQVDIRIHETLISSQTPWTVRCGPNGTVTPVTG